MNFWQSLAGMVEVELTSAEPEAALLEINRMEIEIRALRYCSELSCQFQISRRQYSRLKSFADKRGEKLRVVGKRGIYWKVKGLLLRPVYLAGLCFLVVLTIYLPTRILFVEVSGNTYIPDRAILAAAEEAGICFGAYRRDVRSEKVKNILLSQIPQLQWVGVNTSGCTATVSVRERTDAALPQETQAVSRIIAARDGYIISGTVTQGQPLFQIGQTVKAGEVLVSGYTDCGICIRATRSEGEIFAQTQWDLQTVTPAICSHIQQQGNAKCVISLRFRKKRINLWKDSGISPSTCGRMYQEYCLTLPGGFELPIVLCLDSYIPYAVLDACIPEEQAEQALSGFAEKYLLSQMAAGEIHEAKRELVLDNGVYRLQGKYICTEMIGRERPEQIGEPDGKNS